MRKPGHKAEDALSSYTNIMTSTVRVLASVAILLGAYTALSFLYGLFISNHTVVVSSAAVSMLVAALAAVKLGDRQLSALTLRIETWMDTCSTEIGNWVENASPSVLRSSVIATAGLSLFLELILIRWEAGLFVVFALYKNFTLLACFCGLGIGYAKSHDKQLTLAASLPMTALLLLVFSVLRYGTGNLGNVLFQVVPVREEVSVFFGYDPNAGFGAFLLHSMPVYGLLAFTF